MFMSLIGLFLWRRNDPGCKNLVKFQNADLFINKKFTTSFLGLRACKILPNSKKSYFCTYFQQPKFKITKLHLYRRLNHSLIRSDPAQPNLRVYKIGLRAWRHRNYARINHGFQLLSWSKRKHESAIRVKRTQILIYLMRLCVMLL